jgi:ABC-2 type transport system ATP-binding protein
MIDVDGVVFDHPSGRVLRGVSFVVRAGAILGVVGPEGAGKSTLIRCIATLETPGEGRITVAGRDTQDDPRGVHAVIGYVPGAFGLYEALSVGQCLRYAARSRGVATEGAEDAAVSAAEAVGIAGRMPSLVASLSAADRLRLALAQAVVHRPRVLLLDGAASAPTASPILAPLIARFATEGMTIIVAAESLSALPAGCSDALELEAGLIQGGGVRRLDHAPDAPQTP